MIFTPCLWRKAPQGFWLGNSEGQRTSIRSAFLQARSSIAVSLQRASFPWAHQSSCESLPPTQCCLTIPSHRPRVPQSQKSTRPQNPQNDLFATTTLSLPQDLLSIKSQPVLPTVSGPSHRCSADCRVGIPIYPKGLPVLKCASRIRRPKELHNLLLAQAIDPSVDVVSFPLRRGTRPEQNNPSEEPHQPTR